MLVIGIAGAATLANSLVQQQEWSAQARIMLNYQEQAARLYQLGLSTTQISALMPVTISSTSPPASNAMYFSFSTTTPTISGAGNMERLDLTAVFPSRRLGTNTFQYRTNLVLIVRPTIR
jgi:hypothetical protein